ncbi:M28 family peptidase [Cellulosimicrobium funkei]|nr:M28 family peptidase [Cellulosimicrobium funkei]
MPVPDLSRRAFLAVAGGGALSTIAWPAWAADGPRPGAVQAPRLTASDRQIVNQLRPENAIEHLTHLSETIGQRYSGTPQEADAAQYIAGVLDGYGYDVEVQTFQVPDRRVGELSGPALDANLCWGVGSAVRARQDVSATGTVLRAPTASASDLPQDLAGRVVLRVVEGSEDVTALATEAAARGAVAVVATRADAAYPRQSSAFAPSLTADVPVPVVGLGQVQKHALLDQLAAGPVELTVTTTLYPTPTSQNVLANRPGKKGGPPSAARDRVMLCAHYDSVIGARGANDDGSGTVLCLELARAMRNVPTGADLSFALWGSEEVGLVGSRLYAGGLDAAERARFRGVFNNDMVGTSWDPAEKYWVLDYLGQSNPVNAEVLAAGERLGYRSSMSDVTQRGSSDHQSFSEVGVHSGNFSWRGVETPALLEPGYHSADDTIARNISVERLTVSMEIQGAAAYALARP